MLQVCVNVSDVMKATRVKATTSKVNTNYKATVHKAKASTSCVSTALPVLDNYSRRGAEDLTKLWLQSFVIFQT